MGGERDEDEVKAEAAAGEPEAGPSGGSAPSGASPSPASAPSAIDELRNKMTAAANEFLKTRLGLEEAANGRLELPDRGVFENLGQRADEFVRGFFRGFVDKTPEEREALAGLRDPKDVPNATEVVGRLLGKVSEAVSGSFHQYLKEHAVDPASPDKEVVVDGRFILRHGAPLLASFVQALGTRFSPDTPHEPVNTAPAEGSEAPGPHVDYKVDLPSVFKSLFVRPASDEGDKP